MSSYAPAYPSTAGQGSSSSSYPTSSSTTTTTAADAAGQTDPYAPFYYWDATTASWAFDYPSYYATYGYPQPDAAPSSDHWGAAAASSSSSAPAAWGEAYDGLDPFTASAAYPTTAEGVKGKQQQQQPKTDENGHFIPGRLGKGETRQTVLRKGAGKVWEDQTLLEWDPSHKRLFIGDLGNDVSDSTLSSAFSRYPSFSKARVIRKKDGKGKGYGFVSFSDPEDFLKAWKEMDGKYIGSRPCRIKKASEEVAPVAIGARKDKMLAIAAKRDREEWKSKMGGAVGKGLVRGGKGGGGKPYAR